jgi:hypothetical protein
MHREQQQLRNGLITNAIVIATSANSATRVVTSRIAGIP